jgi:hypothetical protein
MAEVTYTRAEIDRLTDKIGRFAKEHLTKKEWDLLLAIFAAAADDVTAIEDPRRGTLPGVEIDDEVIVENPDESDAEQLRDQLLRAHTPGRVPPAKGVGESVTP